MDLGISVQPPDGGEQLPFRHEGRQVDLFGADLAGDGPAVDEGRRHGRNPTGASQSQTRDQLGQCRKCRRPVTTTAMPRASAAASTSSSRTDPPGWITAVTPAWAATSMASGNGKNASLAIAAPLARSPAFRTAIHEASTRDICPAPIPTVAPSLANTMAFDFTCAATIQAIARSR